MYKFVNTNDSNAQIAVDVCSPEKYNNKYNKFPST